MGGSDERHRQAGSDCKQLTIHPHTRSDHRKPTRFKSILTEERQVAVSVFVVVFVVVVEGGGGEGVGSSWGETDFHPHGKSPSGSRRQMRASFNAGRILCGNSIHRRNAFASRERLDGSHAPFPIDSFMNAQRERSLTAVAGGESADGWLSRRKGKQRRRVALRCDLGLTSQASSRSVKFK
ncbi:hypothetical protein IE53DRAFT_128787 [Violaceomyces palustris]|uniref:Uncharacterized protein n=1 Tax=Violaceomyces palustris TaxID=1673888 RepID=A0ACD0NVB7_9BASI|nr:hypothetical protein IE53DRAFT_128787 [Violaceomyces palustris]